MRSVGSGLFWVFAFVLLVTACGSDAESGDASETAEENESETTTTTSPPTTEEEAAVDEETTTSEAPTTVDDETTVVTSEGGLPATPVAAFLAQTYTFGSEQGVPTEEQLPFPANSVTAHWYQSEGFYVVVYGALDPALEVCPGNSIQTSAGFVNVSNAPMNGADCSFAPVVAEAPAGVVMCNRLVSYVTLIPADTEGTLFGTVELMADGLGVGLTSQAIADPANTPEITRDLIDC